MGVANQAVLPTLSVNGMVGINKKQRGNLLGTLFKISICITRNSLMSASDATEPYYQAINQLPDNNTLRWIHPHGVTLFDAKCLIEALNIAQCAVYTPFAQ